MTSLLIDIEDLATSKPTPPLPSDCCGSGCSPCVHDIYAQELETWKKGFKNPINTRKEGCVISPEEFKEFEIIDIKLCAKNSYIYTFKIPDEQVLGIDIGQHILVKEVCNDKKIVRQYTPISDLTDTGTFELLIKIYPNGKMTSVISEWLVGKNVLISGPFGSYKYVNKFKNIVMLAAGTGIAPMYQIIKCIVDNKDDYTQIVLWYACKTFDEILLRSELLELQCFWNFKYCLYISEDDRMQGKYGENVKIRRILKNEVQALLDSEDAKETQVLICGTKSFNKDMLNASLNAEVPQKNIFKF